MSNETEFTTNCIVAYYRVSTKKQGDSGLGLQAQVDAVARYAEAHGLCVSAEFTEVETGTSKRMRPEIQNAIAAAKERGCRLVIAKLDRLARNVKFVSTLMESGVDFVACDNQNANTLTIHILAAVAEDEAKRISERTKAGLAVAKARGTKLGTPENLTMEARMRGGETMRKRAIQRSGAVTELAQIYKERGMTLQQIADKLNALGERTPRGKLYASMTVKRILDRAEAAKMVSA